METKFQTSFIPKKQITQAGSSIGMSQRPRRNTSLFMSIAVLLFLLSLGAIGGTFAWKSYLENQQLDYKKQLSEREKQFNADLIEELKRQNIKIDVASQLLQSHLATSQIFDILGRLTIENVRFLNMDMSTPTNQTEDIKVSMKGYGTSFAAVAFQSDVLGQLEQYGLRKIVKNPIISDPALDQAGTVAFGFSASISPASLSYEKSIAGTESASTTEQ